MIGGWRQVLKSATPRQQTSVQPRFYYTECCPNDDHGWLWVIDRVEGLFKATCTTEEEAEFIIAQLSSGHALPVKQGT